MNMKKWADDLLNAQAKRPLPILSFPSVSLLGITVNQLTSDAELQAKGMKAVSERMKNAAAAVSMMDLSVEAESFGRKIKITADEVPTVISPVAETKQQAAELKIPAVGAGRTGIYVDAIKRAKQMIDDRPVFAGIIGPFSLAGRLVGVTEAMIKCYEEPEVMLTVLKKAADFLKNYAVAFKSAGADGIVINPYGANFILNNEMLESIAETVKNFSKETSKVSVGDPKNYPLEMVRKISECLWEKDYIEAAYLKIMLKDGKESYLVALEGKLPENPTVLYNEIAEKALPSADKMPIDFIDYSSDFAQRAFKGASAFYKKKD